MSAANKDLITRLYREVSQGNLNIIDEDLSDDFVEHEAMPGLAPTREGVRQMFESMRTAFTGFGIVADDMAAEGDRVFVRATMSGTHDGDFMGIPATGKKVTVPLADFFRIQDGKVAEHWGVSDFGSLMQQLSSK